MDEWVIQTRGLTRYFGPCPAVEQLDLRVPRGSVFALLGRNGSGKTTTLRMLLGLLPPTRGSASVLGHDPLALPPETRARLGYLAENHPLYGHLTVAELASFQSAFYPRWNPRIFQTISDYFRLAPRSRARQLSRGQHAGLALALTLATEPELLILDDPALGLDPVARRTLLEAMVYVTRHSERTILFSSHLLADVERVADHIAVLDRAILRAQCPIETFRSAIRRFVLHFPGNPPPLPDLPGLLDVLRTPGELRLTLVNADDAVRARLSALGPASMEEVPLDFEEAFVSYLGEHGEKSLFLAETEGAA